MPEGTSPGSGIFPGRLRRCSDIVRRYLATHKSFESFPRKVAIQMNDTHPSLAVAELMRILWMSTVSSGNKRGTSRAKTFGYTNHTLLPEALEKWPVATDGARSAATHADHLRINHRLPDHDALQDYVADDEQLRRMSVIEEGYEKQVRMAQLAIVGSHAINGVSALHTDLLKSTLVPDFVQLWPESFSNKTNGVAPRRWLLKANPRLSDF